MSKTTQELIEIMKSSRNYDEYLHINRDEISQTYMKIDRALNVMLADKKLKKSDVIAKSGIEIHYAYQIFSGTKTPARDKVIMLCFGFCLSAYEAQQLLKITGYPQLYVRNERDNAILFGMTKKISVVDMNNMLYDLNMEILV